MTKLTAPLNMSHELSNLVLMKLCPVRQILLPYFTWEELKAHRAQKLSQHHTVSK